MAAGASEDGRRDTAGPVRLPREKDFWRLWLIGLAMFVVRWLEMLCYAIFVYERSGSPFLVASMAMLRLAPMGLFGAFLGAWADGIERRSALIGITAGLLVTSIALAILMHVGELQIWHLGLASFINGLCWAADNPVRRMMIGEVVGTERLGYAMGIEIGSNNASRIAGPTIGGLMMATGGIYGAFVLGAALYAIALVLTLGLRHRNTSVAASGQILTRLAQGLRFARESPRLRGILVITMIFNLFGWPSTSMIPVIGQDDLHLGPAGTGVLASMDGLGALLGAIVLTAYGAPRLYAFIYVGGVVVYLACLCIFALMPDPLMAGLMLVLVGIGGACFSALQATLVYQSSTPDMRARMMGLLSVCIGIGPFGFLHLGLMAGWVGVKWAVVLTGLEGLAVLALTFPVWRSVFVRATP